MTPASDRAHFRAKAIEAMWGERIRLLPGRGHRKMISLGKPVWRTK